MFRFWKGQQEAGRCLIWGQAVPRQVPPSSLGDRQIPRLGPGTSNTLELMKHNSSFMVIGIFGNHLSDCHSVEHQFISIAILRWQRTTATARPWVPVEPNWSVFWRNSLTRQKSAMMVPSNSDIWILVSTDEVISLRSPGPMKIPSSLLPSDYLLYSFSHHWAIFFGESDATWLGFIWIHHFLSSL